MATMQVIHTSLLLSYPAS